MIYSYDGTFDGFLTVIFEIYRLRSEPVAITRTGDRQEALFTRLEEVNTDQEKADRVWNGLAKKLTTEAHHNLFQTFLSELPETELLLFRYIRLVLGSEQCMEQNYADRNVLQVIKIGRRVW